mmetsp:Transcript_58663/g.128383  ORF Transcript_58663/g.128383 Transcript_58663/m.128383 type:complete len:228 (-) Transcript_58663:500-1183(-)
MPQGHHCVGILLDSPNLHISTCTYRSASDCDHQRPSSGSNNHGDQLLFASCQFVLQTSVDRFLVLHVLHGIFLKGLVRLRFQIILQGLQRCLQVVVVRLFKRFLRRGRGTRLEEPCHVVQVLLRLRLFDVLREALQNHLNFVPKELHQESLVSLRKDRKALLVGEEGVRGDDHGAHWFPKPSHEFLIRFRQIGRELQTHLQPWILIAQQAQLVPRVPTIHLHTILLA